MNYLFFEKNKFILFIHSSAVNGQILKLFARFVHMFIRFYSQICNFDIILLSQKIKVKSKPYDKNYL